MTLSQREGYVQKKSLKNKRSMYHQNNEGKKQDGEGGGWFDTPALASENALPKGQQENIKGHILQTDDSPPDHESVGVWHYANTRFYLFSSFFLFFFYFW